MLSRVYELRDEVVFGCKTKNDLLLALLEMSFNVLSFLTDVFEALNQLNKKLQDPESTIIMHTNVINAFAAKLNLWSQRENNFTANNFASFH